MIDQEIRIAIAEKCGLSTKLEQFGGVMAYKGKDGNWVATLPDYCLDLNVMHEAVLTLRFPKTQSLWKMNQHCLEDVVSRDNNIAKDSVSFQWEVQNATARQRAEAFLKVFGLWKE